MGQTFTDHILAATREPSVRAVAKRAGIESSTLTRQLKGGAPVSTVVAICRAYRLPFLDTFAAAGFITEAEASASFTQLPEATLRAVPETRLAAELLRRAENRSGTGAS